MTSGRRHPGARVGLALAAAALLSAACGHHTRDNPGDENRASPPWATATPYVSGFTWSVAGTLPVAVHYHAAFAYSGYLYVLGGVDAVNVVRAEVWGAQLLPGGGVGAFFFAAALPAPRVAHAVAVDGSWAYVSGGNWTVASQPTGTSSQTDTVFVAPLNSVLIPGGWSPVASLPRELSLHAAGVARGHLFVAGGLALGTATPVGLQAGVYSAPINGAAVGAWQSTAALVAADLEPRMVVSADVLTVLGGTGNFGTFASVWNSATDSTGNALAWNSAQPMPSPAQGPATTVHGTRLVVAGGAVAGGRTAAVFAASLTAGITGTWDRITDLPIRTSGAQAVSYGGYVYVIGGAVDGPSGFAATDVIWSAPIP